MPDFRRDRLTWVAYGVLAWFAYLQATPGLVIVYLRDELDLSKAVGGLNVVAFAAAPWVQDVSAQVITHPVDIPISRAQQPLHSVRRHRAGLLGPGGPRLGQLQLPRADAGTARHPGPPAP